MTTYDSTDIASSSGKLLKRNLHHELTQHRRVRKTDQRGDFTSLNDITNVFKAIFKEAIQTASKEELTSHLRYDNHQTSDNTNSRNISTIIKHLTPNMGNLMSPFQEIENLHLNHN